MIASFLVLLCFCLSWWCQAFVSFSRATQTCEALDVNLPGSRDRRRSVCRGVFAEACVCVCSVQMPLVSLQASLFHVVSPLNLACHDAPMLAGWQAGARYRGASLYEDVCFHALAKAQSITGIWEYFVPPISIWWATRQFRLSMSLSIFWSRFDCLWSSDS